MIPQQQIIQSIKPLFSNIPGIETAMLIGGFGRQTAGIRSDIDISLMVSTNDFNPFELMEALLNCLPVPVLGKVLQRKKGKMGIYFKDMPKIDIQWFDKFESFLKYARGSNIQNPRAATWYDRKGWLKDYVSAGLPLTDKPFEQQDVEELMMAFCYNFELASFAHFRSDAYQFYFLYNLAFHKAIQLKAISAGEEEYNYLPPNFLVRFIPKNGQSLHEFEASIDLTKGNDKKRKLLDFVYSFLDSLNARDTCKEDLRQFCEAIYERDFLWNFRDAALGTDELKKGRIYRSSSLTRYQGEDFFPKLIRRNKIGTVVDLRNVDELRENPYEQSIIQDLFAIRHLPIDPRHQSQEFIQKHHIGSGIEIAYRFFVHECKAEVRAFMEVLHNAGEEAVLVHCFAGKDRTGFIIALVQLLLGVSHADIVKSYMASGMDTSETYINIILEAVEKAGGIESYLLSCGLDQSSIQQIKKKYQS